MARVDPLLLVVASGVASQLEDLSSEVFHHGCQVDWSTSTDSLSVVTPAKETMDTTNWELKSSTTGARLGLGTSFAALSTSWHFWFSVLRGDLLLKSWFDIKSPVHSFYNRVTWILRSFWIALGGSLCIGPITAQ